MGCVLPSKEVKLDGQILHGTDRFGWWQVKEIIGWDETPPEKSNSSDVVNGHGEVPAPVYYGPRTVSLKGRLVAKNHELAISAKRVISALLQSAGEFVVTSSDGIPLTGVASRGRITPGGVQGRWLPFEMELRFSDSFRYGKAREAETSLGTSVEVFHRGTVPAWPVLTVSGSAPGGYALSIGGRLVRVTAPLVSGSPHTLDMRTGILRAGGSRVYAGIAEAEYFSVPRGLPSLLVTSLNTTGSGTVRADFYDTYI